MSSRIGGGKKSASTLAWETRKQQLQLAVKALESLSPTRIDVPSFGAGTFPGGGYQIAACCHVLDPSPNSPLLSALNAYAARLPSLPSSRRASANFQSLYKSFRPPTSLDQPPALRPPGQSLLFYEGYDSLSVGSSLCPRSTSTTSVGTSVTKMLAPAVLVAGDGAMRLSVKSAAPAFSEKGGQVPPSKAKAAAAESSSSSSSPPQYVSTETGVEVSPGDVLLIPSKSFKELLPLVVPPAACAYVSEGIGEVLAFLSVSLNTIEGGLMVSPLSSPFSSVVSLSPAAAPSSSSSSLLFLPPMLLLGTAVVRRDVSGLVPRSLCFVIPSPSLPSAYGLLKDFADSDKWKADLNAGSAVLTSEQESQALKDGVRSYLSEKEALAKATSLANELTPSPHLSPSARETKWRDVGKALRAVGGSQAHLQLWTQWTLKLKDSALTADRCRTEWRRFKPCTNLDGKDVEDARVKVGTAASRLKELMLLEGAGDFELHKAKLDVERAAKEGVEGKDLQRVLFLKLTPDPRPKRNNDKKDDVKDETELNESNISDGMYEKYRNADIDRGSEDERDDDNNDHDDDDDDEDSRAEPTADSSAAFLTVASLRCSGPPSDGSSPPQSFTPGGPVPAEVRKLDRVLLSPSDAKPDGGGGLGQGVGADSAALLAARAERSFGGGKGGASAATAAAPGVSKKAGGGSSGGPSSSESDKLYWATVLDVDALSGTLRVSTSSGGKQPDKAATKALGGTSDLSLGCLWGAWVYRPDEVGLGGTLWRLPSGDMYWGLKTLRELVEQNRAAPKRGSGASFRDDDEDENEGDGEYSDGTHSAHEVDEDMDFRSDTAKDIPERSDVGRSNLQPALKVGKFSADLHGMTIAWAPGGSKVTLSIAGALTNPSEKSWKVCFTGVSNACVLKNLTPGTPYRIKVETAGRRPQFATFYTAPRAPPKLAALEWIGNELKSRSLKVSLTGATVTNRGGESAGGRDVVKRTVRVEVSDDGAKSWSIAGDASKGEESLVLKSLKVGKPCCVRSRYVVSDGTVGVASEAVDVGVIPKRPGIILLSMGSEEENVQGGPPPLPPTRIQSNEGPTSKFAVDEAKAPEVRASTANFAAFLSQLEGLIAASGAIQGEEELLPDGWRKVVQDGGKCYYHNERSSISSWTKPS